MKRFIVLISALFCISLAQDIAGSWTLTGVDVNYYNFVRPNMQYADPSFEENQYANIFLLAIIFPLVIWFSIIKIIDYSIELLKVKKEIIND
mgnify:CR=1 FL=1